MSPVQSRLAEDHPLQWLQPTPEISAPMALLLPPGRWVPGMRAEALSGTSFDSDILLSEAMSDATTSVSEHGESPVEQCWAAMSSGSGAAEERFPLPPQLTPSIPSMSASPPPPPANEPLERPYSMVWQTPSPTAAFAACLPFPALAAGLPHLADHAGGLAPTLLEAAGSFSALGAWSETCEGVGASDDKVQFSGPAAGVPSGGSAQHALGKCKPCAFVHRVVGCGAGAQCTFCHLCSPGEKKRRQREKFESMRRRRERRAATMASLAETAGSPAVAARTQGCAAVPR